MLAAVAVDQRVMEEHPEEATEERRQVMAAKATAGEHLDMVEHIRHQRLGVMDNNQHMVRELGQMKILVSKRCVAYAKLVVYY
jgi:uncharacterized membrane protein (DUF106 family)